MRNVIRESVTLSGTPVELWEMFLSPKGHEAITGSPVTIGEKPGAEFRGFNGALTGTILEVVRPSLIVQSWRSTAFREQDPDSTLILSFQAEGEGTRIDLVHLDVPDHDFEGVTEGWGKHYWTPWRNYLASR